MRGKRAKQLRRFANTFPTDTKKTARQMRRVWKDSDPAGQKHMDGQMKDVARLAAQAADEEKTS
jgi:hypothetical protein